MQTFPERLKANTFSFPACCLLREFGIIQLFVSNWFDPTGDSTDKLTSSVPWPPPGWLWRIPCSCSVFKLASVHPICPPLGGSGHFRPQIPACWWTGPLCALCNMSTTSSALVTGPTCSSAGQDPASLENTLGRGLPFPIFFWSGETCVFSESDR